MEFINAYEDTARALSYSTLDFPGTYYLAFRDIHKLLSRHVNGWEAIDFGCGAGRSTRFLRSLGFRVVGLDISAEMIRVARELDPGGDYRQTSNGILDGVPDTAFDLVFSAFTFDNIPTMERKTRLFNEFNRVLRPGGVVVNLVSSPEMYTHDWISIKTTCFPENYSAVSGDPVFTIITDTGDFRPVQDELCTPGDYQSIWRSAGFKPEQVHAPLGYAHEPYPWVNEHLVAPWNIYVLRSGEQSAE
jgi:ubiquinone/menaquinone biosynthesis C-methylase UbiE